MDEITEKLKVAIQKWLAIEGNKSRWDAYQIEQNNMQELVLMGINTIN